MRTSLTVLAVLAVAPTLALAMGAGGGGGAGAGSAGASSGGGAGNGAAIVVKRQVVTPAASAKAKDPSLVQSNPRSLERPGRQ
jgi:hypothetical protein